MATEGARPVIRDGRAQELETVLTLRTGRRTCYDEPTVMVVTMAGRSTRSTGPNLYQSLEPRSRLGETPTIDSEEWPEREKARGK